MVLQEIMFLHATLVTSKHRSKMRKLLALILTAGIAFVLASIAFVIVWIRSIIGKRKQEVDSAYVVSTRGRIFILRIDLTN